MAPRMSASNAPGLGGLTDGVSHVGEGGPPRLRSPAAGGRRRPHGVAEPLALRDVRGAGGVHVAQHRRARRAAARASGRRSASRGGPGVASRGGARTRNCFDKSLCTSANCIPSCVWETRPDAPRVPIAATSPAASRLEQAVGLGFLLDQREPGVPNTDRKFVALVGVTVA